MAKGVKGSSPKEEDKPKRTSFNLMPEIQEKVRHVAFVDRTDMTAIVNQALTDYITKWEKKNGAIRVKKT